MIPLIMPVLVQVIKKAINRRCKLNRVIAKNRSAGAEAMAAANRLLGLIPTDCFAAARNDAIYQLLQ
jgi:hypothetical protein